VKVRSKVTEWEVTEVKCGLCNGFVSESLTVKIKSQHLYEGSSMFMDKILCSNAFAFCLYYGLRTCSIFKGVQGVCKKKLSYMMLFFVFKASESHCSPSPAYFRNDY
jgi:hypothetical protein